MNSIKYFHLLSDGKTVRELTWGQWRKICNEDYNRKSTRLIIRTHSNSEFHARKGKNFIYIPRQQLDKVLK